MWFNYTCVRNISIKLLSNFSISTFLWKHLTVCQTLQMFLTYILNSEPLHYKSSISQMKYLLSKKGKYKLKLKRFILLRLKLRLWAPIKLDLAVKKAHPLGNKFRTGLRVFLTECTTLRKSATGGMTFRLISEIRVLVTSSPV